jgi:hypothetical protein
MKYSEEKRMEISEKRKATCLAKYGVEHVSKAKSIKDKTKETCLRRYGSTNTLGLDSVKSARELSLSVNSYEINEKRKMAWNSELIEKVNASRKATLMEKYGVEYSSQLPSAREAISAKIREKYLKGDFLNKLKAILIDRYGVETPMNVPGALELSKQTSQLRYGSDYYLSSKNRREILEQANIWIPLDLMRDFEQYRRLCIIETNKHKRELFSKWDGKCYYTGLELITDSIKYNDKMYRTIDHKISIYYGYVNGISEKIIGHIDNLCICSRSSNSSKGVK